MNPPRRVVVIHTAFIGDVVLALPMVQQIATAFPGVHLTFVAIPAAAGLLRNHPAVAEILAYDKRGTERGMSGVMALAARLRAGRYDTAVVPHRSLRSALLAWWGRIPQRIGFSTSSGRFLFTDVVRYDPAAHETRRNADLLVPLGIAPIVQELPRLYPGTGEMQRVNLLLDEIRADDPGVNERRLVALAPGSVWATKRWPAASYAALARQIEQNGGSVIVVGGEADRELCASILAEAGVHAARQCAGRLTLLESAELIRRCRVIVSNDSAPAHLATAVGTPVVAIFGATVPRFGFGPQGPADVVVETTGLSCRPCGIHGGDRCPIKTFVCMERIMPERVFREVMARMKELPSRAL